MSDKFIDIQSIPIGCRATLLFILVADPIRETGLNETIDKIDIAFLKVPFT